MSALAHVDPLDANWRILQDSKDKPFTARALSREATQQRRQHHGTKCYKDGDDHFANPHQRLTVVTSGLQMPEATLPKVDDEPYSDRPASADDPWVDELFEAVPSVEFSTEIPFGFHIEPAVDEIGSVDGPPLEPRQLMISQLARRTSLDLLEPDEAYAF